MERFRDVLRQMIFGRRGCRPDRVALYRAVAVFDFTIGLAIPTLLVGRETDVGALPLAVFSLMLGVPGGRAIGRWLVPPEGIPAR
jgi:hypothetical protein